MSPSGDALGVVLRALPLSVFRWVAKQHACVCAGPVFEREESHHVYLDVCVAQRMTYNLTQLLPTNLSSSLLWCWSTLGVPITEGMPV